MTKDELLYKIADVEGELMDLESRLSLLNEQLENGDYEDEEDEEERKGNE